MAHHHHHTIAHGLGLVGVGLCSAAAANSVITGAALSDDSGEAQDQRCGFFVTDHGKIQSLVYRQAALIPEKAGSRWGWAFCSAPFAWLCTM